MSCDYQQLPHPGIQSLVPYLPGKSIEELAREQGIKNIIKLASNENPLGCSPAAKKALMNISNSQLASYPSPKNHPLQQKLSQYLGVDDNMLLLSNGSDFIFHVLLTTFALHTQKHLLTHDYAFSTYQIQAQTLGIPIVSVPINSDWQVNINELINACQSDTAIIFLANPNNPTGLFIPGEKIQQLLQQVPLTTIVVIDEAYYEYAYSLKDKTSIARLAQHPNLVITRTFSKAYGLAGLRMGYAIANPEIISLLQRVQLPFTVNQAALEAAYAALEDTDFVKTSLELNKAGMKQIQQGLTSLKLEQLPSNCNFITFHCGCDAQSIYQRLLQHGIIVRPLNSYGLLNYLRVTVGTKLQNTRFLDTLTLCL